MEFLLNQGLVVRFAVTTKAPIAHQAGAAPRCRDCVPARVLSAGPTGIGPDRKRVSGRGIHLRGRPVFISSHAGFGRLVYFGECTRYECSCQLKCDILVGNRGRLAEGLGMQPFLLKDNSSGGDEGSDPTKTSASDMLSLETAGLREAFQGRLRRLGRRRRVRAWRWARERQTGPRGMQRRGWNHESGTGCVNNVRRELGSGMRRFDSSRMCLRGSAASDATSRW